jgi:hypothetical protein
MDSQIVKIIALVLIVCLVGMVFIGFFGQRCGRPPSGSRPHRAEHVGQSARSAPMTLIISTTLLL